MHSWPAYARPYINILKVYDNIILIQLLCLDIIHHPVFYLKQFGDWIMSRLLHWAQSRDPAPPSSGEGRERQLLHSVP
jgi:hypothetical protein